MYLPLGVKGNSSPGIDTVTGYAGFELIDNDFMLAVIVTVHQTDQYATGIDLV